MSMKTPEEKLAVLKTVLESAGDFNVASSLKLHDARINVEASIDTLNSQLAEVREAIKLTHAQITLHDTQDLETIHSENRDYEYRTLHLTPRFNFDIVTSVPIRDWKIIIPSTSSWASIPDKKLLPHQKLFRFQGRLRNKRTLSASVSIELLGRRCEIHAGLITEWCSKLGQLETDHASLTTARSRLDSKLYELDRLADRYRMNGLQISSDVMRLKTHHSVPLTALQDKSRNMYCFASALGLQSAFSKEDWPSQEISKKLTDPYPIRFFTTRKRIDTEKREKLKAMEDATSFPFGAPGQTFWSSVKSHQASIRAVDLSTENGKDWSRLQNSAVPLPALEVATGAIKDLTGFNTDIQKVHENLLKKSNEHHKSREESLSLVEAAETIRDRLQEVERDLDVTNIVMAFLLAKDWPIAVYACFAGDTRVHDGWNEVWEGVRLRGG